MPCDFVTKCHKMSPLGHTFITRLNEENLKKRLRSCLFTQYLLRIILSLNITLQSDFFELLLYLNPDDRPAICLNINFLHPDDVSSVFTSRMFTRHLIKDILWIFFSECHPDLTTIFIWDAVGSGAP